MNKGDSMDPLDLSQPDTAEAVRMHLLGDREGSRVALEKLLVKEPKNYFFHYLLAESKYALGFLDEAARHYRTAIELKPDFGVAYYKIGVCLYRMGKLTESLESFSAILAMKGQGHAMASYFYGLLNQFLGNDAQAEEGFRILRGVSKQSLIANYYLARLKLKHSRWQEAIPLLEELLLATPGLAEAWYLKGLAHMGLHDNMEASTCFRKTLELNPTDTRARGNLELLTEVPEP
jgi:tetratricopeptide (TPR) repeat protein